MDLRQLEMFAAVAEQASFTRASQTLYVAQSAISRKISLLEAELGEALLVRSHKRVTVTPAGETLLRYCRRVFQDLKDASLEIAGYSQLDSGQVRIAAGLIAGMYLLPPALERFKAAHPRVTVTVETGSTESLMARVRSGVLDLALVTLPVAAPDLVVTPLPDEDLVVAVSPKHPRLGKRKTVSPRDLADEPFILFPPQANTRRVIDRWFKRLRLTPQVLMEAENVELIKPLVRIDLGISIVPARAVSAEASRGELQTLEIQGHRLTRRQGLVHARHGRIPRVIGTLMEMIEEAALPATPPRQAAAGRA